MNLWNFQPVKHLLYWTRGLNDSKCHKHWWVTRPGAQQHFPGHIKWVGGIFSPGRAATVETILSYLPLLVGNLSGFSSRSFLPPLEASWSIFIFCGLFEHHHYFRLIQWLVGSWQVPSPVATVTTKNGGNDFRQQTRIPTLHHCRYGKSHDATPTPSPC